MLAELSQTLRLNLPSGRQRDLETELPTVLQRISDYDPAKVRPLFKKLAERIGPLPVGPGR